MSSTRLPGKSLADVGGEPMLGLLLKRLEHAHSLEGCVVATSVEPLDDILEVFCRDSGVAVVRGPLDDVLMRFLEAAGEDDAAVVRITADCPLIDPAIVDAAVRLYWSVPGCRYAHNVEPRTYPDGLDVEVIDVEALREVAGTATAAADREHVTTAIRRDAARFPARALALSPSLGHLGWTVDHQDDLEFVREVVSRLGQRRYEAGLDEILAAVRREPSLAAFKGVRG
jgi:spore coat polysaccharide biosynthesis protein SpsF